jgi:hypothetical protein
MTVGVIHFLFVGAAAFAAGAFLLGRQWSFTGALAAIPLLLGGAGLDAAAVGRFAGSAKDVASGQELAVLAAVFALAFTGLGAGLARLESPR